MYDNFEPFLGVTKHNFDFQPSRFEMWIGGKMINSGKTNQIISARANIIDGAEKMQVIFSDSNLFTELAERNIFDEFLTAKDRLQMITVPAQTNVDNMGIMGFKMIIGATREIKNFNRNEPYCCNLFLENGIIVKVTFSYSNPEKLLEFYN